MKKITTIAILIMLLSGCATYPVPTLIHLTKTPSSTPILVSTSTLAVDSPTPTLASDVQYLKQCSDLDKDVVSLKDITSGTILLMNELLDIQSGKKYPLRATNSFDASKSIDRHGSQVSPDQKMLAYVENMQNDWQIVWVVDARGHQLAKISLKDNQLEAPRWLDNERLIFYTKQTDLDGSVLVLNPFTQEKTIVSNELPNRFEILTYQRKQSAITWLIEYSPNLSQAIYTDNAGNANLRDLVTKKTLWHSEHSMMGGNPAWSPNGEQVAVMANGQAYLVDRFGQSKPIMPRITEIQPSSPSWSPDGSKVSFWNMGIELMIYDLKSEKLIDPCIRYNSEPITGFPTRWSPDGTQLIIGRHGIQIYDLSKNTLYSNIQDVDIQNGDYIHRQVWMRSLP